MTKEDAQRELSRLSEQIDDLIASKKAFIKDNMYLFADFEIGQIVVNKDTLERGKIVGHYQATYGNTNDLFHYNYFNVHCEIDILNNDGSSRRIRDNTSRHIGRHPWMDAIEFWEKTQQNLI